MGRFFIILLFCLFLKTIRGNRWYGPDSELNEMIGTGILIGLNMVESIGHDYI